MARRIVWTLEAELTLSELISYLDKNWSKKEVPGFLKKLHLVLSQIVKFPLSFPACGKEDIREALVTRHNLILYRVTEKAIHILYVWDTRKNPINKPK